MKVLEMQVSPCTRKDITDFIEQNHYSQSINGCIADYCFRLDWQGTMIGAMFYGRMAMHNQWKRFSQVATNITELRRLCCVNDTPKNTESYFIGNTLRWLKKNTEIERVVSYADAEYGHSGTIYRASNFKYLGLQTGAKVIYWNGKKYHDKTIRTKYNGVLKPFAQKIKDALVTGEAYYQKTAGKHCFIFDLNPKSQTLIKF